MMNLFRSKLLIFAWLALALSLSSVVSAQKISIDVNLDVKHILGKDSVFDRNRFVTIHADVLEREWDGDNEISGLRNDFLNGYDVYLGRNTGGITWNLNHQVGEDPNRPGFANPSDIESFGAANLSNYANNSMAHFYEHRNDQVLCAQLHPFYPDGQKTNKGWALSTKDTEEEPFGVASGEFMGRYIAANYGQGGATGQPTPKYLEVINEPLWHLYDLGDREPEEVFRFHNAVADQVRKFNPDKNIQIGGYCSAFPDFDKDGFKRWQERWKLFMDISGEHMDFWTIHLYDWPAIGGKQIYRKGSNLEATFDMMEQYSYLKFGRVKPIMISEYGAMMHDYKGPWSAYRDWLHMKSVSPMMMQFIERSNIINKTINFLPVKAEWGTAGANDTYNHRLLRKANEPDSYTGKWVYTENVKVYQLWADVKGARVDSWCNNPDQMVDAYVNGNKAYIVINNLDFVKRPFEINLSGNSSKIISIKQKHLYLDGETPLLEEKEIEITNKQFEIESEGTIVLEYTFQEEIQPNARSIETKYYSDKYLQPIKANTATFFKFSHVEVGEFGEAVLRIGMGRDLDKSLTPTLLFNDVPVEMPTNFRGDNQGQREGYFGVVEVKIPYQLIEKENTVSLKFNRSGGHVSTVTMQVFNFSKALSRTGEVPVEGINIKQNEIATGVGQARNLQIEFTPTNATTRQIRWKADNPMIVMVDQNTGVISGFSTGETTIRASSIDGEFMDSCLVTVQSKFVNVPVDSISTTENTVEMIEGHTHQLMATIYPLDALNKTIVWKSEDEKIAQIDANGLITALKPGNTRISISNEAGDKTKSVKVNIREQVDAYLKWDDQNKYVSTVYLVNEELQVSVEYHSGSGNIVTDSDGGIKFWLREIRPDWSVVKSHLAYDATAIGKESGTATANISLKNVLPSSELPEGNFYYLFVTFRASDGKGYNIGLSPIQINVRTDGFRNLQKNDTKIYPNPANNYITIEYPQQNQTTGYKITSIAGKTIQQGKIIGSNRANINVSAIQQGFYFLTLTGKETQTVRFIKNH